MRLGTFVAAVAVAGIVSAVVGGTVVSRLAEQYVLEHPPVVNIMVEDARPLTPRLDLSSLPHHQ